VPWQTAQGALEVDHLYLVVDSVLLQPCQDEAPTGYGALGASVAWAHGDATPTQVAAPLVMDLMGDVQQVQVGSWLPPEGRYCEARLWLAAADDDALQLDQAPWMEGLSAALEGRHEGQPVRWTTTSAFEARVSLDPPLVLGKQDSAFTFLARWNLPPSWSQGVDLSRYAARDRLPDELLLALGDALEVELLEEAP
jgi:surface antigen